MRKEKKKVRKKSVEDTKISTGRKREKQGDLNKKEPHRPHLTSLVLVQHLYSWYTCPYTLKVYMCVCVCVCVFVSAAEMIDCYIHRSCKVIVHEAKRGQALKIQKQINKQSAT